MFRFGTCLLFITFAELIAVILFSQVYAGGIHYALSNIHPLIGFIILFELAYSGFLTYKGYSTLDRMN